MELALPSETLAAAQEAMIQDGVSFVENFISDEQRRQILDGLDDGNFVSLDKYDFTPVQGRLKYLPGSDVATPDLMWDVRDVIIDSFNEFSSTHPEFVDWVARTGERGKSSHG